MFDSYCENCITQSMCFEQGLCIKKMVDEALGNHEDSFSYPEAELTEKAQMDHLLLMADIERKKDDEDNGDTL